MRAIERGFGDLSLLPDALRDALRRRLRELAGLALLALAILLALALATWSVQDPSLSHATNRPVRNLRGFSGAIIAGLLMQLFGLAALALILPVAVWGWRLLTHRPLSRERLRLIFWIAGVLFAAGSAAALRKTANWPLPGGLGGVVGDWLIRVPTYLAAGAFSGAARTASALASGVAALFCFAVAFGYGWQADRAAMADATEREERASISPGRVAHGFLSP